MDSTVKESFVTALSQPESSLREAQNQVELCEQKTLEAVSKSQEALDTEKAINAKSKAPGETDISQATMADSQVSTQVETGILEKYIQLCVAKAPKALKNANGFITTKRARETEKVPQPGNTQSIPAAQATDAATESHGKEEALKSPTESQSQKRIRTMFTAASGVGLNARLLIAYPRNSSHLLSGCSVVPLGQRLDDDELFAIIQTEDDVGFSILLPTYQRTSTAELNELQIAYDVKGDECYLRCINQVICLTNLETGITDTIRKRDIIVICPGVWRVSVSDLDDCSYSTIDILVLSRPFEVAIHRPKQEAAGGLGKRQATDDLRFDEWAKRQKGSQREIINSGKNNKPIPTLVGLRVGSTAEISSQCQSKGQASYTLKIDQHIYKNAATDVYKCRHSNFDKVAAKVFRYQPQTIFRIGKDWKKEKELLQQLDHGNVVKLLAADARIFTLYLEFLPESLCDESQSKRRPFPVFNALVILLDISSALYYLKTQNLVHYDIKPKNIAYSDDRGAVLLDFGLSSAPIKYLSGTCGYLPPETFDERRRDFAGDIWALGITTLYIRGHIELPETSGYIRSNRDPATLHSQHIALWSECVFPALKQLKDQKDKTKQESGLCSLVFKMLRDDVEARVGAAELSTAAQILLDQLATSHI